MFKARTIFIILIIFFISCKNNSDKIDSDENLTRRERILHRKTIIDSVNYANSWKKLSCGLHRSKKGDLGYAISEGNDQAINIENYITELNDGRLLKHVIDTLTFRELGSFFYKDKNHIYQYFGMADGGYLSIFDKADFASFEVIGDCYAKDKNHIFAMRSGIMNNADHATFRSKVGMGCYAKDKFGYYYWDDLITNEQLETAEAKRAITQLK